METKTKFKDLSFKAKLDYIWDYYKIPIIVVIVAAVLIASFVRDKMAQKESVLSILCINSRTDVDVSKDFDSFLSENEYSPSESEITVNQNITLDVDNSTDYSQIAALTAYYNANEYDISIQDQKTFNHFSTMGIYDDLTNYLSDDILNRYKDDIIYITDSDTNGKYACGIKLTQQNCSFLKKTNLYDTCILSICHTGSDPSLVNSLCNYIFDFDSSSDE